MPDQVVTQSADTKDQSFKIKVDGVEKVVTREEMIELAQKGDDYTRKTQSLSEKEKTLKTQEAELADMRRYWDEMKADPGLNMALRKTHEDYKSGKISKSEERDRNLKTLDRKLEEAKNRGDLDTVESLRDIRSIIGEESGSKEVQDKISKLEQKIEFLQNSTLVNLATKVEADLGKLKTEYGKDLVEKYEKDIRESAVKYPNQSVDRLFKYFAADDSGFDEALLKRAQKRKEEEIKTKSQGSSTTGAGTVTKLEPIRDSKGRIDFSAMFKKSKESGRI